MRSWISRLFHSNYFWLVGIALFPIYGLLQLKQIVYNFDEGVHLQQIALMLQGQRPYLDFFYHQPPLYLTLLWIWSSIVPNTLFFYRLPSLIATTLTNILLFRLYRKTLPTPVALIAVWLFSFCSLQRYGCLLLPNSTMIFFLVLGTTLLISKNKFFNFLAGVSIALAVLSKPLALPVAVVLGLGCLAFKKYRPRFLLFLLGGMVAGLLCWWGWHYWTDGVFTQVLKLQWTRYQTNLGLDVMMSFRPFADHLRDYDIETMTQWNWHSHVMTFGQSFVVNSAFYLLMLAAIGTIVLMVKRHQPLKWVALWSAWLGSSFIFCVWIWGPSWDHYFLLYLPAMAWFAAIGGYQLWQLGSVGWQGFSWIGFILVLLSVGLGFLSIGAPALKPDPRFEVEVLNYSKVLSFSPFLGFVTHTKPACGLIDPFNTYGSKSLTENHPAFKKFHISTENIIQCLNEDPTLPIFIDAWTFYFLNEKFLDYIALQSPSRFLYYTANDEYRLQTLIKQREPSGAYRKSIAAGSAHTLQLNADGTVASWGSNMQSQLGRTGQRSEYRGSPVRGLHNIIAVAAGDRHSLALALDGTVWAWGGNALGQLGVSGGFSNYEPHPISNLRDIVSIAAGAVHNLAVDRYGSVWVWGNNDFGQLGTGTTQTPKEPVRMVALSDIIAVFAGTFQSFALQKDGTVWAWGSNSTGQLGIGDLDDQIVPVAVQLPSSVVQIASGKDHTVAILSNGELWGWGSNQEGQLGIKETTQTSFPIKLPFPLMQQVDAGGYYTLALDQTGHLWEWGIRAPVTTVSMKPQKPRIIPIKGVTAIEAGITHNLVRKGSRVWIWGNNSHYQLGISTEPSMETPHPVDESTFSEVMYFLQIPGLLMLIM